MRQVRPPGGAHDPSVRLSVTLMYRGHISRPILKVIIPLISL